MRATMMDYQLTVPALLRRAESYFKDKLIVSRRPDRTFHRYTVGDACRRSKQLGVALLALGLERGDRVATLCWNHYAHHEAYAGVPAAGLVLHTLNARLHADDLGYIAADGGAKVVIVDAELLPLLDQFRDSTAIEHVFVVENSYERLVSSANADEWTEPVLDESEAAAMCYTSGTTGVPKGVVYSHRSTVLHTLGLATRAPHGNALTEADRFMPVVPMFHANAWGYPYVAMMVGMDLVYPGRFLDAESLLDILDGERVTWTAGVPTVWLSVLERLEQDPDRYDLSALKGMICGGSAASRSLIDGFHQHGVSMVHGWGMTEMSPVGSVSDIPSSLQGRDWSEQLDVIELQGLPLPLVEMRIRGADGVELPWDDVATGELEVRGPWVASQYISHEDDADKWTSDGWFKTGDIASIDSRGFLHVRDRLKDVVKSGGEWISSVALENALMSHPAVSEAAVVGVPDNRWIERPLAAVVLKAGQTVTPDELRDFIAPKFPKFWLPDRFEFIDAIPKTGVGKFRKTALREQFSDP